MLSKTKLGEDILGGSSSESVPTSDELDHGALTADPIRFYGLVEVTGTPPSRAGIALLLYRRLPSNRAVGLVQPRYRLGAIPYPKLPQNVLHILLHGAFGDEQLRGDGGIRTALRQQFQDFDLAIRQHVPGRTQGARQHARRRTHGNGLVNRCGGDSRGR